MRQYFSYQISELSSVRESFVQYFGNTVRYGTIRYDRLTLDSSLRTVVEEEEAPLEDIERKKRYCWNCEVDHHILQCCKTVL